MKNKKLSKFFSSVGWCLSFSWETSKFYTIMRIGIQILLPILTIGTSFIGKYIINLLAGIWVVEDSVRALLFLFVGLLSAALLKTTLQKITQYYQVMHGDILRSRISLMMMGRSFSSDLEYFDNPDYYDKLLSATRDSSAIINLVWNAISGLSAMVSFLGVFIVLSQANILYCLLMMIAAIPSSIVAAKYTKSLYRLSLEQINSERRLGYYQNIALSRAYAQDLRLYDAGDWLKNRYKQLWDQLYTARQNTTRKRTVLTAVLDCLPEIAIIFIGINIAFNVLASTATVGDYSLYTGLVGQLWGAISQLSYSAMQIYDNQLKIDNIRALEEFQNHVSDNGTRSLKQVNTISFDQVCFTYPGTQKRVLNDVTFNLRFDEKVVLVGINGSGKTTLIKLLLRMYDPDDGTILINGIDIREYSLASLRNCFSVYFQEMHNFSFSLRENFIITDVSQEYHESLGKEALKASSCDDILEKASQDMNKGLTRYFEKDGIELSNGQHQKLALARTLYRRHSAIILDEPSSNLDPKAEHEIFESLRIITEGKMTLYTSHRLSNVFLADRIIVLEEGKVVEDGTQEELLNNKQRYAELFNYQKEKFVSNKENEDLSLC